MYGYCRTMEHDLAMIIPNAIKSVIHLFGAFYFKWNHGTDGGNYKFDENDAMKLEYDTNSQWSILALSEYILSSDESNKFEWEIRMDKGSQSDDHQHVFCVGFVSHPISTSITNWNVILSSNSVYINDVREDIQFCGSNGHFETPECDDIKLKIGSRFKFIFDFKQRECSIYHDDKFYGIFAKNMSEKVIPIIACWRKLCVTCTKFGPLSE